MSPRAPVPGWARAALLYGSFALAVALTFANTPDDGFIALRYAANLVHGYGPVYNAGQRVEGFTSPLWVVVSVVAYVLPGALALFKLKLASLLFGLLAVREAGRLLRHLALPTWVDLAGVATIGLCPVLAYGASNALETTLEMWLLAAVLSRLVRDEPGREWTLWAAAFALALTRLDAVLPILALGLAGLAVERRERWARLRWVLGGVAGVAVSVGAGALYYGSWLPNTFYAKSVPLSRALGAGFDYLKDLLQPFDASGLYAHPGLIQAVALVEGALALTGVVAAVRGRRRGLYLVAVVVGQAAFVLAAGGDYMPGGRFLAPAAIPFVALEAMGLAAASRAVARGARPALAAAVLALGAGLMVATSAVPLGDAGASAWRLTGVGNAAILEAQPLPVIGRFWAELPSVLRCVPSGSTVALTEIGYAGFARLDLRVIDLRGLTDRAIARNAPASLKGPTGVSDPEWYQASSPVGREILAQRPEVVVEIDAIPSGTVLDGQYRLVRTIVNETVAGVYLRRGWSFTCPRAAPA